MTGPDPLEIFLAAPPGLEDQLRDEAEAQGFRDPVPVAGGVVVKGGWPEVQRANLTLRGAERVLVRIARFRAGHVAELDKRARKLPWAEFLSPDVPVRVEASAKRSRLYHTGAIAERIENAIHAATGAPILSAADPNADPKADPGAEDAPPAQPIRVLARLDKNECVLSLDVSGAPLHKRGWKLEIGKAPLRETLAALMLRACGYRGREPVLDPMCGAGAIPIEAAQIALNRAPGRDRDFAFERLANFDPRAYAAQRAEILAAERPETPRRFYGFDRDAGAVARSRANAERAGVSPIASFAQAPISALERPDGPPGLVLVNPPYGARIGETNELRALYGAFGDVMRAQFTGWRVGLITSDPRLAKATGLKFQPPGPPIPHGGLRIRLYRTGPLP